MLQASHRCTAEISSISRLRLFSKYQPKRDHMFLEVKTYDRGEKRLSPTYINYIQKYYTNVLIKRKQQSSVKFHVMVALVNPRSRIFSQDTPAPKYYFNLTPMFEPTSNFI